MPAIQTAEEATDIAIRFARKYLPLLSVLNPLKASFGNGKWVVVLDVGVFAVKKATFTVDATSGDVAAYDFSD